MKDEHDLESSFEENLLKEGFISKGQLETVKLEQKRSSISIVEALRRLNIVSEDKLQQFLLKELRISIFPLKDFTPSQEVLSYIPADFAWNHKVIPLVKEQDTLAIGLLDPLNFSLQEQLRFKTGLFIRPYLIKESELADFLSRCYDRRTDRVGAPAETAVEDDKGEFEKPTIIEAVNLLITQAVKSNASDVHLEPHEGSVRVRLRIDGVLEEVTPPSINLYKALASRVKIMSNLDIAEKRIPQDGRFQLQVDQKPLDVRVSVLPTIHGESIVLRLLSQDKKILSLEELGMLEDNLKEYTKAIYQTSGMILVTGPTGSGKSTTLYASLSALKTTAKNIITIEDPVEYELNFCRQIPVNPKVNLTFAAGLRSILRHDPDIIMVGEIRDLETATIAVQAALTGHLVFSTLHTNDAVSAITRLVDMGIEPFLVSSCVNLVIAQRLVRVLCPQCKKSRKAVFEDSPSGKTEIEIYEPAGCQSCLQTGYSGRIGIFELMEMTPEVSQLTVRKANADEITQVCRKHGMRFLYDDGWNLVRKGVTSPQELLRVLGRM